MLGASRAYAASNGPIVLKWMDGTEAGVKVNVAQHRQVDFDDRGVMEGEQRRRCGPLAHLPFGLNQGRIPIGLSLSDCNVSGVLTPGSVPSPRKRRINCGALPPHLPREEIIIDVEDKTCACCGGLKHRIGEDVSERLDVIPTPLKVIVTCRPKYACRACAGEGGAGPGTGAADRERNPDRGAGRASAGRQICRTTRRSIARRKSMHAKASRSTALPWPIGPAAALFALRPVHARLLERLKQSTKLFADDTTAPVLDPGRGRVKKGQL